MRVFPSDLVSQISSQKQASPCVVGEAQRRADDEIPGLVAYLRKGPGPGSSEQVPTGSRVRFCRWSSVLSSTSRRDGRFLASQQEEPAESMAGIEARQQGALNPGALVLSEKGSDESFLLVLPDLHLGSFLMVVTKIMKLIIREIYGLL